MAIEECISDGWRYFLEETWKMNVDLCSDQCDASQYVCDQQVVQSVVGVRSARYEGCHILELSRRQPLGLLTEDPRRMMRRAAYDRKMRDVWIVN